MEFQKIAFSDLQTVSARIFLRVAQHPNVGSWHFASVGAVQRYVRNWEE
jgi:hypothetical protein